MSRYSDTLNLFALSQDCAAEAEIKERRSAWTAGGYGCGTQLLFPRRAPSP